MAPPNQAAQSTHLLYRAYLVRLWRDEIHAPWRASAQSVQTGALARFATIEDLFAFLEVEATSNNASTATPTRPPHGR